MQGSGIRSSRPKVFIIVAVVLIVVFAGLAGFFFWKYTKANNDPNAVAKETTQRLIGKIGKFYLLPDGEDPTVAQVQDKEKLKDQPFFTKGENGDYILIYSNAKLAILYREKDNKLINVGPIALDQGQTAGAETQAPPAGTKKP